MELVCFSAISQHLPITQVEVASSFLFRKRNILAAVFSTWAAIQEAEIRNLLQSSVESFSLILYLSHPPTLQSFQHLDLSILHFLQSYVTYIIYFLRSGILKTKTATICSLDTTYFVVCKVNCVKLVYVRHKWGRVSSVFVLPSWFIASGTCYF